MKCYTSKYLCYKINCKLMKSDVKISCNFTSILIEYILCF